MAIQRERNERSDTKKCDTMERSLMQKDILTLYFSKDNLGWGKTHVVVFQLL
jgi:hypothetical protein